VIGRRKVYNVLEFLERVQMHLRNAGVGLAARVIIDRAQRQVERNQVGGWWHEDCLDVGELEQLAKLEIR
jgi:hypothetical protein